MTTNSPNPVDGDVQALIELAKRISHTPLKVISETVVCPGVYSSITSAEIHSLAKVALAALTAEPYAYASRNTDMRKESQYFSGSIFNNAWGYEYTLPLYTTPPAQLLRPVELPDLKVCSSDYAGSQLWIESKVWNKAIDSCAEALRKQGYEVKND
ncbi:MAG: hypothetical protein G3W58_22900 [Pantoea ananatis]|nr:hypothetical protein [Pantoea ananatis]